MYPLPKPRRRPRRPYLAIGLVRLLAGSVLMAVVVAIVVLVVALPGHRHPGTPVSARTMSPSASPSASRPAPANTTASPLPAVHFVAHPQPVPVLVYHHVSTRRREPALLVVSKGEFAAQLAYLRRHGYHAVTLQRVFDAWQGHATLPDHPIVLTFDDGYADQYRNAAHLLRSYRWPAVLDVIVKNIDRHGPFRPSYVRQMIAWGWQLASHTITHRPLTALPPAALRHELVGSRDELQKLFHVPVAFICYPGGEYNARVERAVRQAGFLAAMGTTYAAALPAERFALPRIYCYWGESLTVFGRRLNQTLARAR